MELGGFQKTVLLVAIGILSISLFGIAVLLMKEKRKKVFPNEIPECPDYYQTLDSGCSLLLPFNKVSTKSEDPGGCANPGKIFRTQAKYTGANGRKEKCKWAKRCGLAWDGVSNQNIC